MPDVFMLVGIVPAAAAWAVDLALKGALVLTAGFAAWLVLRRASAASRHLAWTAVFAVLLALPVLSVALPAWRVPLLPGPWLEFRSPIWVSHQVQHTAPPPARSAVTLVHPEAVATPVEIPAAALIPPAELAAMAAEGPTAPDWGALLPLLALGVWAAGAELVLLSLLVATLRVRSLGRRAQPLGEGRAAALLPRLMARAGVRRPVLLLEGDDAAMPLTWGVRRPCILLPAAHREWPADRLEAVLLHELAHVRRRDCLTQLLAGTACALHWFNPLAWVALRWLRLEAEHASDDQVLAAGAPAQDYAGHLLDVVRALRTPRPATIAAVSMARRSQLRTRLLAVLSSERRRGAVPPGAVAGALAGAGLVAIPLAVLSPTARGADGPAEAVSTTVVRYVDTVAVATVAPAIAAAPVRCGDMGRSSTHRDRTDGRTWNVTWHQGQCRGSARLRGWMDFAPGGADVLAMGRGAVLDVELRDARGLGRVEVVVDGRGISRRWWRDGERLPWGPEARAWLAGALPEVLSRTGFDETHHAGPARRSDLTVTETTINLRALRELRTREALEAAQAALRASLHDDAETETIVTTVPTRATRVAVPAQAP